MADLTPELLLRAYAMGVFPMAESRDDPSIYWIDPDDRGILPLDRFHISRSLSKRLRQNPWRVSVNEDFRGTVLGCADREETWINAEILSLYEALHDMGFAHSLELWDGEELIGGTYGVALGTAWFGESMFSRRRDASKVALAYLTHRLRAGGFTLFDTQFITPHLASLGGVEIPRDDYQALLKKALQSRAVFEPLGYSPNSSVLLSEVGGSSTATGGL